jgi:Icc-related predicted phosphoesterase
MVTKINANSHKLELDVSQNQVAILSDLHWDNPKTDLGLLKSHLDYCLEKNIPVIVNGDFFCLMQGKGDRRSNKSDIRPEHNNAKYLDSIVETAVEWFSPYANILAVLGYGNHETAIIKYQETDILQRFVDLMNHVNGSNIQTGGYGGWINIVKSLYEKNLVSFNMKYFHGSGGGGIVTKGGINLTRALEMYENMDIFCLGHIHENWCRNDVRDSFVYNPGKHIYEIVHRQIHHMITGTYKEEYGDGSKGWHIERGAPPKPLGGRILNIDIVRRNNKVFKQLDSTRFPLI